MAGGWFSILMSVIYASIMLLWSWGKGRKDRFFKRQRLRLDQMVALQSARDDQLSFTISQQKLALQDGALRLKRVRGVPAPYFLGLSSMQPRHICIKESSDAMPTASEVIGTSPVFDIKNGCTFKYDDMAPINTV